MGYSAGSSGSSYMTSDFIDLTKTGAYASAEYFLTNLVGPGDPENPQYIGAFNGSFSLPVPEPATWTMMIMGFGLVGKGCDRDVDLNSRAEPRPPHQAGLLARPAPSPAPA